VSAEMLTAKGVAALQVGRRRDIRDAAVPGLILRLGASGTRAWSVWGRVRGQGRPVRVGLGRYPRVSLARAREEARHVLGEMALGRVPGHRAGPEDPVGTVERLVRACLDALAPRLAAQTISGWERLLRAEIAPAWGSRDPRTLARAEIRAWLAERAKAAPYVANRVHELLRRAYRWAGEMDLLTVDPTVGIRSPHRERPRDRVLSTDEASRVWLAAGRVPLGQVVRLLLLTGARRGEVLGMRWQDVDLPAGLWRMPGEARKGGDAHTLPLVASALVVLRALRRRRGGLGEWVFPSPVGGPVAHPQGLARRIKAASGVAFRLHDLRRTVATRLAEAGTRPDVVEAVLGHRVPALIRTYQVYRPLPEMRAALEAWERVLTGATSGGARVAPSIG